MMEGVSAYTIAQSEKMMGDEALAVFIQSFSCSKNLEVEGFLKSKARQSERMSSSVTYLVWGDRHPELLGYFTLTAKAYSVKGAQLNSANRRLVERFAEVDENGFFNAAVYLIAQIGKNFAIEDSERISGDELLRLAFEKLYAAREIVGGKLVLVERDMKSPELVNFYTRWNFRSWNERHDGKDGVDYDQMLCVLSNALVA